MMAWWRTLLRIWLSHLMSYLTFSQALRISEYFIELTD